MVADQRKMAHTFLKKCCNSGNNSQNCTVSGAQEYLGGPFDLLYFELGVTSRDLSMTLTVVFKSGRRWTLAPKLLGWNGVIWGNRN